MGKLKEFMKEHGITEDSVLKTMVVSMEADTAAKKVAAEKAKLEADKAEAVKAKLKAEKDAVEAEDSAQEEEDKKDPKEEKVTLTKKALKKIVKAALKDAVKEPRKKVVEGQKAVDDEQMKWKAARQDNAMFEQMV